MEGPARILIADDDEPFRRSVVRLLSHEGYQVHEVDNPSEALARISADAFELLIADVNMRGEEGLSILREQDEVPVLVVTGQPTLETALEALRRAAVDYLAKPLSPQPFLSRVADGVARGRALQTLRSAEQRLRNQLDFITGLRDTLRFTGGCVLCQLGESTLPQAIADPLSQREREVLRTFRATPRTADVAAALHISPHTVKNHMKAIFRKLEVSSQAELLTRLGEAERERR
ncbi:MAG: response regulator transcription factor [Enhygromyxa sp.]